jgi:hypothetical protein
MDPALVIPCAARAPRTRSANVDARRPSFGRNLDSATARARQRRCPVLADDSLRAPVENEGALPLRPSVDYRAQTSVFWMENSRERRHYIRSWGHPPVATARARSALTAGFPAWQEATSPRR